MKKLIWAILCMMLVPMFGQAVEGFKLVCAEPVFNFGEITKGTIVTNVFKIQNEGDLTCLVSRVYTSCGCTKGSIDKTVIDPDGSALVTVVFDSTHRSGIQDRSIRIMSSTAEGPALKLRIEGDVKIP